MVKDKMNTSRKALEMEQSKLLKKRMQEMKEGMENLKKQRETRERRMKERADAGARERFASTDDSSSESSSDSSDDSLSEDDESGPRGITNTVIFQEQRKRSESCRNPSALKAFLKNRTRVKETIYRRALMKKLSSLQKQKLQMLEEDEWEVVDVEVDDIFKTEEVKKEEDLEKKVRIEDDLEEIVKKEEAKKENDMEEKNKKEKNAFSMKAELNEKKVDTRAQNKETKIRISRKVHPTGKLPPLKISASIQKYNLKELRTFERSKHFLLFSC